MLLEMKVKGLALDPLSNMPMIILRDEEEKRSLPIWVGLFEANAIALELEKISTPRPMTHDLIKNILESLDARVLKIVVNDLRDNTFYALIYLELGGAEITVDSRPSDAIALALRVGAPIFVDEEVVQKAKSVEVVKGPESRGGAGLAGEEAKIKEWLESLKPADFDKIEPGKDPGRPDE
jgi:bifunctional DNase/RNase